ncbi:iron chelate uptake ABC transporter family permease subunit [Demequina sp. NBRC 110053]|uniref:iron chelate uptake ABC transporter family permease subunit n=1 Tax=Demequina sp. NBRC 110053 TaxID=1570342 RepID=UPI0009FF94FE|nr:iron chelate uptake ABC transporter family permease subunit [Demequina sp. NBRC 110053]
MPPPDVSVDPVTQATGASRAAPAHRRLSRVTIVLTALSLVLAASVTLFLTWDVGGHWDFALPRRLEQVAALAVVGIAVAVSTVVFQTLTQNRILTPSIMGFDALYVLLATTLVFVLGSRGVAQIPDLAMFGLSTGLLVVGATLLYRWVLSDQSRGLYTLVLVGVIAGTLFSSFASFMFRVMNPNEFAVLMDELLASFNRLDTTVLGIAAVVLLAGSFAAFRMRHTLDVLSLGREKAIALGIDHRRTATRLLVIIALLVAVSTALVGPIVFLGLLVANLAYQLTRTHRHAVNLVAASLIAVAALTLGQALLEHVLDFNGTLGSIINLVGGVYFIALLVKEARS